MSSRRMMAVTAVMELFMKLLVALCASNFIVNGFMAYETFQAWNTLYLLIPVTGYFFARRYLAGHGKVMMLVHLLFLGSVLFAVKSSIEDTVLVFGLALVFMVMSLKKKTQEPFVPLDLGIILVGYILSDTLKSDSAAVIPAYSAVAYVICFLIYMNLKNVHAFLEEHAQIKSFKADQAMNVNVVMMAVFMLFCFLAMFIAPRLHIQDGMSVIGRSVGGLIVKLLRMLDMPTGGFEQEFNTPVKTPDEEEASGMLMLGTGEGSMILDTIVAVLAVVLIAVMVILGIRAIRQIRFEKISGTDVKEFIRPEFTDVKTERNKKRQSRTFGGDLNQRVRKKYKRFVQKNKTVSIAANNVPEEITRLAGGTEEMTRIYEKARYSNEMVTEEEYTRVK